MIAQLLAQSSTTSSVDNFWVAGATIMMGLLAVIQVGDRFWKNKQAKEEQSTPAIQHLAEAMSALTENMGQLTNAVRTEHEVSRQRHDEVMRNISHHR